MTEQEWLASDDPAAMLRTLRREHETGLSNVSKVSDRKLRLFACACCRQVWDGVECRRCKGKKKVLEPYYDGYTLGERKKIACPDCYSTGRIGGLTDPHSRNVVEVAERYADGLVTDRERFRAWDEAIFEPDELVFAAARYADEHIHLAPAIVCRAVTEAGVSPALQAALLREIVGNPFWPVTLPEGHKDCDFCDGHGAWAKHEQKKYNPLHSTRKTYPCKRCDERGWFATTCPWLTHNDGAVVKLATVAYEERRWDILPLIADALEDAGCTDEAILRHLRRPALCVWCKNTRKIREPMKKGGPERGPEIKYVVALQTEREIPCPFCKREEYGPHVRGCWALDLFLGKE